MRRWTVNGRFLSQPETGVQRSARELVRALDALIADGAPPCRDLSLEIVAPPDARADLPLRAVEVRRVGRLRGHAWEQAELPAHAPGGLVSLCNTGPVRHRRQIVCIHDMNTRLSPQSYSAGFRALYRILLPALGRSAVAVSTVSAFSADAIARHGVRRRDRIAVIPNGCEHAAAWTPRHSDATRRFAGGDAVVVLGGAARHKNLGLLLGLAEPLAQAGLRLVVVGAADPRVFRDGRAGGGAEAVWLGRLGDRELSALLRDGLCLAFPSLTEGFGMPPLEAMAVGCPAVVSDRGSIPEICGDAALYAAPDDPAAWMAQFRALRDAPGLRDRMVARGRARCAAFSWRAAALAYLRLMAKADGADGADGAAAA